jgi:hypothetical protein
MVVQGAVAEPVVQDTQQQVVQATAATVLLLL